MGLDTPRFALTNDTFGRRRRSFFGSQYCLSPTNSFFLTHLMLPSLGRAAIIRALALSRTHGEQLISCLLREHVRAPVKLFLGSPGQGLVPPCTQAPL